MHKFEIVDLCSIGNPLMMSDNGNQAIRVI